MRSFTLSLSAAGLIAIGGCTAPPTAPESPTKPPDAAPDAFQSIVDRTERRDGLLTLHVDPSAGQVWLELPATSSASVRLGDYLYVEGLVSGLGSNPVGLDRGQLGRTRIVTLRTQGGRLLIEQQNLAFRALSDNPAEVRATKQSFAPSVLWSQKFGATAKDGRRLVDVTSFIVRDAHGVQASLKRSNQGDYTLSKDDSVVDTDRVFAFVDNIVFESLLTFKGNKPGDEVAATAATGTRFSIVLRQSLVRLPDDGYRPRPFHPQSGSFAIEFDDYAAPLDRPTRVQWLVRHRLNRGDTLTYYVDPAIPEPVRSAVIEGASWWRTAFAAAGHPDGFRVEVLPDGAHPLDIRYNVIQWVHRATRGWSYGGGVIDPRTGEMLKGHVSLGSLRVRQDRRIFEGLIGTRSTGTGTDDDPIQVALARIRQLAAHEVGHTLGFAHNFAASTYGRASVMDYPAPRARVRDQAIDLSDAYDTGIGEWDVISTRYAYEVFPDGQQARGLESILAEARNKNYLFLSDADARPAAAAHPLANLWDNGADPVAGLQEALQVRAVAIARFGPNNLMSDRPLAELEEVFVPIYFYHRYQVAAAAKAVGGLVYGYAMRDDANAIVQPVDAETQRRALQVLLGALDPATLDIPEPVIARLVPRAFGLDRNRELFRGRALPGFDALGAASTAADLVVAALTQRERALRLLDQHRRSPSFPSLAEVIDAVIDAAFTASVQTPRRRRIQEEVRSVVVARLMALAVDPEAAPSVRAEAERAVSGLPQRVGGTGAFPAYLRNAIRRFGTRNAPEFKALKAPAAPPGSPIGCSLDHGPHGVPRTVF